MPLPDFNESGDLPEGVHSASLAEVVTRFGGDTAQRKSVTAVLTRIADLASQTGELDRLVLFGSYVTAKAEPNDVDVILVMRDDFRLDGCPEDARILFDHARAEDELRASVFWVRPEMLFLETLDQFVAGWQIKRGGGRRGIVEVKV